jgi:N4-gp56 family major capsid protein
MPTTELIGVAGMTNELKTYYSKKLLDRLVPALVHAEHGLQEDLGPNEGKSIEKRRFESFAAATTALVEGTPPGSTNGTVTALTFTVSQYGAYMLVSDVMWQQGFDGVDDIVKAFGENAGNSIDQVIRDALHATASLTVIYASTAASRGGLASGMRLTGLEVRKALRKLRTNNAREFPDGTYHSIIHPDVETDLMADPNVQNILQWVVPRGENHPLLKGSVPQIYGVSFFRTANAKTFPTSAQSGASAGTVYGTLFFGEDSYLVSKFSLQNVRTIIKPPGSGGPIDALDQYGSIGWKASVTAGVLNLSSLLRVESTSSFDSTGNG